MLQSSVLAAVEQVLQQLDIEQSERSSEGWLDRPRFLTLPIGGRGSSDPVTITGSEPNASERDAPGSDLGTALLTRIRPRFLHRLPNFPQQMKGSAADLASGSVT
jgi:hypothetical protein